MTATKPARKPRAKCAELSSPRPSSSCTPAAGKYHHSHGSIFKGSRHLMILVEVGCSDAVRDLAADAIVAYFNSRDRA